jgi:shikimate kinase
MNQKHIVLIGLRGSGKTTIGKILAQKLKRPFFDIDEQLMKAANATSMIEMIRSKGKEWLAKKEASILVRLLSSKESIVLSTGGRTLSHEYPETKSENANTIKSKAIAVLPLASQEEMWNRIKSDQDKEHAHLSIEKLRQNFEDSLNYSDKYIKTAHITLETDGKIPEESVDELMALLNEYL